MGVEGSVVGFGPHLTTIPPSINPPNLHPNPPNQHTNHQSPPKHSNYPNLENSPPPAPGQLRASAHTDYGVLTILRQDEPGLQVQTRKGGFWGWSVVCVWGMWM